MNAEQHRQLLRLATKPPAKLLLLAIAAHEDEPVRISDLCEWTGHGAGIVRKTIGELTSGQLAPVTRSVQVHLVPRYQIRWATVAILAARPRT